MHDKEKIERAAEIQKAIDEADERKRADAEATGQKLDKLLTALDDYGKKIDGISSRVDALEQERKKESDTQEHPKDDDDDELSEEFKEGRKPGQALPVAADRADAMRQREARMAEIQARADQVASDFGERAPKPLVGETARNYRIRMLRRFQHHSKEFSDADLSAIADAKIFAGIETRIYADARAAGASPQVPLDHLREVIRTDPSGRRISTFYGNPRAWMRQFSGSRSFVKRFKTQ